MRISQSRVCKNLRCASIQRFCNAYEIEEGDIAFAALDPPHVRTVDPDLISECFLRKVERFSLLPNYRSNAQKRTINVCLAGNPLHISWIEYRGIKRHGIYDAERFR